MWRLGWVLVPVALAGCGGDKAAATLTVMCGGTEALTGARSIDVLGDDVQGRPTFTFPDPANRGKTGAIAVPHNTKCTVTPVVAN